MNLRQTIMQDMIGQPAAPCFELLPFILLAEVQCAEFPHRCRCWQRVASVYYVRLAHVLTMNRIYIPVDYPMFLFLIVPTRLCSLDDVFIVSLNPLGTTDGYSPNATRSLKCYLCTVRSNNWRIEDSTGEEQCLSGSSESNIYAADMSVLYIICVGVCSIWMYGFWVQDDTSILFWTPRRMSRPEMRKILMMSLVAEVA